MMRYMLSVLVVLFLGLTGYAQMQMPEDQVDWKFTVEQNGCDAVVVATLSIKKGWHINALVLPEESFGIATTFNVQKSANYKIIGKPTEPKPIRKFDAVAGEELDYHEGKIVLRQKIRVNSEKDFDLKLDFGFQPCDSVKCLFPYEESFTVKVKGCSSEDAGKNIEKSNSPDVAASDVEIDNDSIDTNSMVIQENVSTEIVEKNVEGTKDDIANMPIWLLFFLSFGSGLLALITPCVFPMIPMTVSYFTKTSKTKAKGVSNAIKYGISIIVIYILLGTLITAIFGVDALNNMSTNPTFNIVFFFVLIIFAISFMGAFELRLPSSWANKADEKADKGGMLGIFFMALALAIVSFSCTGPIVGYLLFQAATIGGIAPIIGMLGFSLALALPFAIFAAIPGWMNSLPKSGGWLNVVKVVLGLLELALAFKFLSNADLALQTHLLERELFLAIWIGIFLVLAFYLFGWVRFPHDSKVENLSVGRGLFGTFVLVFVFYMIPGLWGAPVKIISAFPPPMSYSESPLGVGQSSVGVSSVASSTPSYIEGTHLGPQNIMTFNDYDKALAYSKSVGKPLMLDFTGHNCVNCRKMEQSVWGEPGVINILRDSVVIASLHVDERVELPKSEQYEATFPNGRKKFIKTYGDKWTFKQISEYEITAQPFYIFQDGNGKDLSNGSADYQNHSNPKVFLKWLQDGLKAYREIN